MTYNAKLFVDDTSLFSVVHDANTSSKKLNDYLKRFNDWDFQWKMSFDPDSSNQAQKIFLVANDDVLYDQAFNNSFKEKLESINITHG